MGLSEGLTLSDKYQTHKTRTNTAHIDRCTFSLMSLCSHRLGFSLCFFSAPPGHCQAAAWVDQLSHGSGQPHSTQCSLWNPKCSTGPRFRLWLSVNWSRLDYILSKPMIKKQRKKQMTFAKSKYHQTTPMSR